MPADTRIVECRIKVGKDAPAPNWCMQRTADRHFPGWFGVRPADCRCLDCGQELGEPSIPDGLNLRSISCSNCYSDRVILTKIAVEIPGPEFERKD
jgi:hypothetical protein